MSKPFPTPDNCPHLIIGALSNVNAQDAVTAFARASRKVKSNPNAPFTIEDLTSALAEIDASNRSSESGLRYSIPANPNVFNSKTTFTMNGTSFQFDSTLSDIDVGQIDNENKESAGRVFLAGSIHQLLQWEWQLAADYARACLRLSSNESERDEALNVIAASFAAQGEDLKALDALKKAVEGEWNLALQANLALLAIEANPQLAIEHMSYLVEGATSATDKIRACRTAINLWQSSQSEVTGSSDQDDFEPLPRTFLNSIQTIISSPMISEETFYEFGKFLARVDGVEFKKSGSLEKSKFANSPSGDLVKARIESYDQWLKRLVPVSIGRLETCPWIHDDIDDFVRQINTELFEANPPAIFVNLAFSLLDDGLDCSNRIRIILRGLIILELHNVLKEDTQPSDKFIDWLDEAQRAIKENRLGLDQEENEQLMKLLHNAGNRLCQLVGNALLEEGRKIQPTVTAIQSRMSGFFNRLNAPRAEISKMSREVVGWCQESQKSISKAKSLSNDAELNQVMANLWSSIEGMRKAVVEYRSF